MQNTVQTMQVLRPQRGGAGPPAWECGPKVRGRGKGRAHSVGAGDAGSARWPARWPPGDQKQVLSPTNHAHTWYDVMKLTLYLCNLPPQIHSPGLIMGTSDKSQ